MGIALRRQPSLCGHGQSLSVSVDHYENFPVASVLCPPRIRPAVVAIYHFARTADDLADEGDSKQEQRLRDLRQYRDDLAALYQSRAPQGPWTGVFAALDSARQQFQLPHQPLDDLLDAFMQDTGNPIYPDRTSLLDYCRRSANPVGRLLLHLYGIDDRRSLEQSDAICSALQLINFWQDLSVDLPRGRVYLPQDEASAHGLSLSRPAEISDNAATQKLIAELCAWAEQLMLSGAPLALRIPGRAGWELRLVIQGGLRILEKIRWMHWRTIKQRPQLKSLDMPKTFWRALCMGAALPNPTRGARA
jgi:hydroxysqualene synthase